MTQELFNSIDWHRGNSVRLTNGKEYPVKRVKKSRLLLYSEEFDSFFTADFRIVEERTSDFIDDTPKAPKPQKIAENDAQAPATPNVAAEVKPTPVAVEAKTEAPVDVKSETAATDAPVKRKRPRIRIGAMTPQRLDIK